MFSSFVGSLGYISVKVRLGIIQVFVKGIGNYFVFLVIFDKFQFRLCVRIVFIFMITVKPYFAVIILPVFVQWEKDDIILALTF